eukprot:CAMPEP_0196574038 /NCGR_PEP_ID=MMETSP1081-20130531/3828_1 /TAXON_ID=36882 /ORGANISM="Pyramimonas amylifera, Strain CCMP720" /LENGTH=403 /DNA_ID=CAMNT_0041891929 /DNA_START=130 /DNA_END=1341 /DNA_ORIENTATION=-
MLLPRQKSAFNSASAARLPIVCTYKKQHTSPLLFLADKPCAPFSKGACTPTQQGPSATLTSSPVTEGFEEDQQARWVQGAWVVGPEQHRQRLDRFLDLTLTLEGEKVNQKRVRRAIRGGSVSKNGTVVTLCNHFLKKGDRVAIKMAPSGPPSQIQVASLDWEALILFEDEAVVCVNKPAGLASVPAPGERGVNTLSLMEAHLLARSSTRGDNPTLFPVHRLDKGTSGVLILARHPAAAAALGREFKARRAEKTYWAALQGKVQAEEGEVLQWHDFLRSKNGRSTIVDPSMDASDSQSSSKPKTAKMTCRVVERFGRKMSVVEVKLQTGRMHQIRAQSASRNHSVLGDDVYGTAVSGSPAPPRLCLHARTLKVAHPTRTDEIISLEAPLPADLQKFLESYRKKV